MNDSQPSFFTLSGRYWEDAPFSALFYTWFYEAYYQNTINPAVF